MNFKIGEHLVYPIHGAGTIVGIVERGAGKTLKSFYEVEFPYGHIKLMIPVENIEKTGARRPMPAGEIEAFLDYVRDLVCEESNLPWNKRQNENLSKLLSNDIRKVAEVYKYLALKGTEKTLSSGEQKLLTNAEHVIFSEIHFASQMEFEKIETLFKGIIA